MRVSRIDGRQKVLDRYLENIEEFQKKASADIKRNVASFNPDDERAMPVIVSASQGINLAYLKGK